MSRMKRAASALWWGALLAQVARDRDTGDLALVVSLPALDEEIILSMRLVSGSRQSLAGDGTGN